MSRFSEDLRKQIRPHLVPLYQALLLTLISCLNMAAYDCLPMWSAPGLRALSFLLLVLSCACNMLGTILVVRRLWATLMEPVDWEEEL